MRIAALDRDVTDTYALSSSSPMFRLVLPIFSFFFFTDPATTEIYTLSLHDALPICFRIWFGLRRGFFRGQRNCQTSELAGEDRKSTRLNSSHGYISYAVFCLKKKKQDHQVRF